jgi:hypothetical protein
VGSLSGMFHFTAICFDLGITCEPVCHNNLVVILINYHGDATDCHKPI